MKKERGGGVGAMGRGNSHAVLESSLTVLVLGKKIEGLTVVMNVTVNGCDDGGIGGVEKGEESVGGSQTRGLLHFLFQESR